MHTNMQYILSDPFLFFFSLYAARYVVDKALRSGQRTNFNTLAPNLIQIHLIFLLHSVPKILNGHLFLSEFDVDRAALLLELRQVPAPLAQ